VVDSEARRQAINGGHMRRQALALLHTWTWVTSRTYAESHRQAAIGPRRAETERATAMLQKPPEGERETNRTNTVTRTRPSTAYTVPEHGRLQLCYRLRRYGCTAHAWAGGRGTAAFGSAACLRAAVSFRRRGARMDGSADRGKSFSPQWLAMMAWAH
jgi:hypothetical protein